MVGGPDSIIEKALKLNVPGSEPLTEEDLEKLQRVIFSLVMLASIDY